MLLHFGARFDKPRFSRRIITPHTIDLQTIPTKEHGQERWCDRKTFDRPRGAGVGCDATMSCSRKGPRDRRSEVSEAGRSSFEKRRRGSPCVSAVPGTLC